jgi:hypothetical protein
MMYVADIIKEKIGDKKNIAASVKNLNKWP